jgi:hypothetical protein
VPFTRPPFLLASKLPPGSVASDIINQQRSLNAGASVLTVQVLLGHKHVATMLQSARVYDRTVATDYARAVCQTEGRFALPEDVTVLPVGGQPESGCRSVATTSTHSAVMNGGLAGQMLFFSNSLPSQTG